MLKLKFSSIVKILIVLLVVQSCTPMKKITYLNNNQNSEWDVSPIPPKHHLEIGDILMVKVISRNEESNNLFNLETTFSTHATTHSDIFTHSKYASLVMKDAIADTFRRKFDRRPNVDPEKPDISINLHISKHTWTVSLDSSGDSLHKRGYK